MLRSATVLASLVVIVFVDSAYSQQSAFRRHVISADSAYSACAVLDVNADGRLDIVCGGWWYEAPDWKRHFVREVEQIRGRYDDYSSLPFDLNGDGTMDLISANYRSQSLYWVENPGPKAAADTAWHRHVVETPGAMETARLFDVDGDGTYDVLPNGTKFAAWWSVEPGMIPAWARFPLPEELAGHGVGFGDINGDGRGDVVGPRGWAEAPEDRRRDRWNYHSEFDLWQDASIPIMVHDVDEDGDADLIWGRGHRPGVYWLEQTRSETGERTWQRHAIDTELSQAHSPLWADLDDDGSPELIAGSRYLGHEGRDPGEYNPLRISAYQFLPSSRTWKRQQISIGNNVGFGLDPKAADLDADGDLDLICPGRSGLYVLENLRHNPNGKEPDQPAPPMTASTYDHSQVLEFRSESGERRPVTNPFEMGRRRDDILSSMSLAMGPLPGPEMRVPLQVKVISEEQADGYLRRRITYTPEPNDQVPAWLLIPNGSTAKGPAMLCLHQTTGIGKGEPAGLGGLENLHYAHELARRGFICLVPDYPSFGDYPYDFRTQGQHYLSGSMKAIWNNIRAVDLLESLPQVDPDRIGCVGHSLGGHNTLFTAAFDIRIKAAVTSCGFTAFHHYYEGKLAGWTSDRYMPRIRDVYENDPNQVPFDFYEVLAAIAPRSIFINAPLADGNFENGGVRKVVAEVSKSFEIYGDSRGELTAEYPDCGHDFPDEVRERAWQWLEARLK